MKSFLPAALALLLCSCGYHVAGRGDAIPKEVRTIAVLPFFNATSRYKLEQHLTRAITHEFLARTRFRVIPEENEADATLRGGVTNIFVTPVIFDPASERATAIQVIAQLQVTLSETRTGRVLYQNQNYEARERYEVSVDPRAYFEESEIAMTRMSQAVARNLVSAILEKF
jgi:outer membrane lipopolysaccharide assembly protein LptE/RlpB